ncbi:MAG TPA: hypothetical protein VG324_20265, partial [Blastocatellia bacterium]|nr:hypothetical protein [Blastocatellia bacterium]
LKSATTCRLNVFAPVQRAAPIKRELKIFDRASLPTVAARPSRCFHLRTFPHFSGSFHWYFYATIESSIS